MELRPIITFVGNTQPHDWNYEAPIDYALTWFAAEYNLPLTADVAFDSFMINPGMILNKSPEVNNQSTPY